MDTINAEPDAADDADAGDDGEAIGSAATIAAESELPPESSTSWESMGSARTVAMDSLVPPSMGPERLTDEHPGRYELERELGAGGMGRVYVAHDRHLGRDVAFKQLLDDAAPLSRVDGKTARSATEIRFFNEARITGQLEHPGVVSVYELGRRADHSVYYTMRMVRGRTLDEALDEGGLFERLELLPHFVDLCNTMAYAHSRGVIHRDLKPENVMLGDYGETVVLDWGLAKRRGEKAVAEVPREGGAKLDVEMLAKASGVKTVAGIPIGTPGYMPPEQAMGELDQVDERSDVYALGVILYRLLAGRPPFEGETALEVIKKMLFEDPEPISTIEANAPPELCAIALRAMQREQDARYPDARALVADVNAFLTGGIVDAHRYGKRQLIRRWVMRNKMTVVGALLLLAGATGAWWYRGIDLARREAAKLEARRADTRAAVQTVLKSAAAGPDQVRWLDTYTFKLIALRQPGVEVAVEKPLIEALAHPKEDVRTLAARALSGMPADTAVEPLTARLKEGVEPSRKVLVEVINALGVLGDARAEVPVRLARERAKAHSVLWEETTLAYRMIPLPAAAPDMDANGWGNRGKALGYKGRPREALEAYGRAIELAPRDPKMYNNRGVARLKNKDLRGALADFEKSHQIDPKASHALNNIAIVKRRLEDFPGALAAYDEVIAKGERLGPSYRNRAILKRWMGNPEGALADLEQAERVQPGNPRTPNAIAITRAWQGRYALARDQFDVAILRNPRYTYAILWRASMHEALGDVGAARADVDRVIDMEPDNDQARRMRTGLRMMAGDVAGARADANHCLNSSCLQQELRRASRLATRATLLYAAQGKWKEALADLEVAIAKTRERTMAIETSLIALTFALRLGDKAAVESWKTRLDKQLLDSDTERVWHDRLVTHVTTGAPTRDTIAKSTFSPSRACHLALAEAARFEIQGNPTAAQSAYATAAELRRPHDLACAAARFSAAALAKAE